MVHGSTSALADGFGVRLNFFAEQGGTFNEQVALLSKRSGANNTATFTIQTLVGGVLGDRYRTDSAGRSTILGAGATGGIALVISDTANTSHGSAIGLVGNGATTPTKFIRAQGGNFQVMNDSFSPILTITDPGVISGGAAAFTSLATTGIIQSGGIFTAKAGGATGEIRLNGTGDTTYTGWRAPSTAPNISYTMPTSAPADGAILTNVSGGVLAWAAPAVAPAGVATKLAYFNATGTVGDVPCFNYVSGTTTLTSSCTTVVSGAFAANSVGLNVLVANTFATFGSGDVFQAGADASYHAPNKVDIRNGSSASPQTSPAPVFALSQVQSYSSTAGCQSSVDLSCGSALQVNVIGLANSQIQPVAIVGFATNNGSFAGGAQDAVGVSGSGLSNVDRRAGTGVYALGAKSIGSAEIVAIEVQTQNQSGVACTFGRTDHSCVGALFSYNDRGTNSAGGIAALVQTANVAHWTVGFQCADTRGSCFADYSGLGGVQTQTGLYLGGSYATSPIQVTQFAGGGTRRVCVDNSGNFVVGVC
jgi:hypothetical protein